MANIKIPLKSYMLVAQKVLNEVQEIGISKKIAENCYIEAYCNGREQGYCLHFRNPKHKIVSIMFSEYRRSDNIVVYVDYDSPTINNIPSEESYHEANMFEHGKYKKAAKFILKTLRDFSKE